MKSGASGALFHGSSQSRLSALLLCPCRFLAIPAIWTTLPPPTPEAKDMPEIARFYGIVIKIYFGDHQPPHFHALYGETAGVFNMNTLEMTEGDLPTRALRLVTEWARTNQTTLLEMWNTQEFRKLPPLE
jgi:hypothetical protein